MAIIGDFIMLSGGENNLRLPALLVTTDTGATVTATLGTQTVTLTEIDSGRYYGQLTDYGTWTVTGVLNGNTSTTEVVVDEVKLYQTNVQFISTVLNDNTWAQISAASDAGTASTIWSVGDTKAVTLNGTVGICTFSNATYYAYIIGFDHNAALEGSGRIHFLFGKTALSGGTDICFIDSSYGSNVTTAAFHMNNSKTNSGGWSLSYMRNSICGTSLSSYSGTFIAALPSDLRSVLKTVTKYTDNTGGGSDTASYVTATTDVIFLLSEWEVFGARTYANSAEKNYQAQYDYYAAGNSKVKYRHSSTGSTALWWLRSPYSSNSYYFVSVYAGGAVIDVNDAYESNGFAPGFCV